MTSPSGAKSSPPSSPRRRLKREDIVVVATKMFAERGYEGTSMGDLAESVGLRKASLFHHFESKDALYIAVLSQLLDAVRKAISGASAAEGTFPDRLDALTNAITGLLGAEPHTARLLVREAMDWGPLMRADLGGTTRQLLRDAVDFVTKGQTEGAFNAELNAEHLVITLLGTFLIPFVLDRTIEDFVGESPYGSSFVERRRQAIRDQIRTLVLK